MLRINGETPSEQCLEFRRLLDRLAWDASGFAKAAKIRVRSANGMWRGDREVPDRIMSWLRSMVATAETLPARAPENPSE